MYKTLGYFNRRKVLGKANFLDLTPIQLRGFRQNEDGTVQILIPKFSGWLSSKLLQPLVKHPHIVLSLDELGAATWLLCNGNNTVRNICTTLKQQFGEKIQPAEERVTSFLSQLYKDKLIVFKEILKE